MLEDKERIELEWYRKRYSYRGRRGLQDIRKNLFRMPNNYEWTILVMLLFVLGMGYAYKHDISLCQDTLKRLPEIACSYCSELIREPNYTGIIENYTKIEINFVHNGEN